MFGEVGSRPLSILFHGGTSTGTAVRRKSRSMTATACRQFREHHLAGPMRAEFLLLLAGRRMVVVRPAMHGDGDAALRRKPGGERLAGMCRDDGQQ